MSRSGLSRFLESIYFPARPKLSCEDCFRSLPLYVEGRLSGPRSIRPSEMRAHLICCPFCQDIYDGLREALREPAELRQAPREV